MGKSCTQQKKICLGGQYYGMTHPNSHTVPHWKALRCGKYEQRALFYLLGTMGILTKYKGERIR